jgi:hypothetical protein
VPGLVGVEVGEVVIVLKVEAVVVAETELGPLEVVEEDVSALLDDENADEEVLVDQLVDEELEDMIDEELEDELAVLVEMLEDDEDDVP